MELPQEEIVSAQVVLRSAIGKDFDGNSIVTGETLEDYLPTPESVARAQAFFASQGFVAGEAVGISFSITAPVATFVRQFGGVLCRCADGGIKQFVVGAEGSYELSLAFLPENIREIIVAVTFTPPPAFGPIVFG